MNDPFGQRIKHLSQLLSWQSRKRADQAAYRFINFEGGDETRVTYAELDRQARAIACDLQQKGLSGKRVLLLYPPGLDYVTGLFACFYANAVAVPAYPPSISRPDRTMARITAIIKDASIEAALTNRAIVDSITEFEQRFVKGESPRLLATDILDPSLSSHWSGAEADENSLALLQYTSGSTGRPKGVVLTHGNILRNQEMIYERSFREGENLVVSWLPPYHDMGLIGGILHACYAGATCCLMSPQAFLRKPIRWLKTISDYRATYSLAPNFALDFVVRRTSEAQREGLDLSSWKVCYNGSEPISAKVVEAFISTFEPYGLKREVIYPCYGMAEATLFISGGEVESAPLARSFDADALERGLVSAPPRRGCRARALVSCGRPARQTELRIVDPDTCMECAPDRVGEIWVKSPSVALGYWRRPEESAEAFNARIQPCHEGTFLRTGDLGVLIDGELYITGRLKDLIIVRGLNYYPHDIEHTVQEQHPALCRDAGAVFGIDLNGREALVVVQELDRRQAYEIDALYSEVLRAIGVEHKLAPYEIVLIKRGSILKTSSGKIQRKAVREAYLTGALEVVDRWRAHEDSRGPRSDERDVSVQGSNKSAANSPDKPSAPEGPARMVLAVPDEPVRGRKPVFRDESAAVVAKQHYPPEQLQRHDHPPNEVLPHDKVASEAYSSEERAENNGFGKDFSAQQAALYIRRAFAEIAGLAIDRVNTNEPLARYGLDSILAVDLARRLQLWTGRHIDADIFYDFPTIDEVARHLAGDYLGPHSIDRADAPAPESSVRGCANEPIAIVGMSCRFPDAKDIDSYWNLLRYGLDAVREVPADRWDVEAFYHPHGRQPGKMNTRWGGFLERVDEFDADFFNIPTREAVNMDPQQRLLLEVVWEALERACIAPGSLAGSDGGVFIGISSSDYPRLYPEDCALVDAYYATGNAHSIAANRISYLLDLRGPSMAIDTACSSSLAALHTAIRSLRAGECGLAVVGAVNLILSPESMIGFSHAGSLSPDGCCRTFDASANGFALSEGAGALILKPLSQAVKDGDSICALVLGSALTHDGRSNGMSAPRGPAQQRAIRLALQDAGVRPNQVGYVEAHGSGTLIGDAIELKALGTLLNQERSADQPCWVASVKTNFGSMEAASGMAAVIKTVLAFQHHELPPHLHLREVNPDIPLAMLGLKIPVTSTPWPKADRARIAGVSSFAFGGANAHVILREAPSTLRAARENRITVDRPFHLLSLSAKDPNALKLLAYAVSNQVGKHSLADLCFSANTGRDHFEYRLAVVSDDAEQLYGRLRDFIESDRPQEAVLRRDRSKQTKGPVWLFAGELELPDCCGRQLLRVEPRLRSALGETDEIVKQYLGESIVEAFGSTQSAIAPISPVIVAVFAFAFADALADLWRSWGLTPIAVMGHGVGEFAAAHQAGVISKREAIVLACRYAYARFDAKEPVALKAAVRPIEPKPARVTFISTETEYCYREGQAPAKGCWNNDFRQTVSYDSIYSWLKRVQPCFVQQTWANPIGNELSGQLIDLQIATALLPEYSECESLLLSLATHYVNGFYVDWVGFDQPFVRTRVALPTYPFQRQRYWLAVSERSRPSSISRPSTVTSSHPLIHRSSSRPISQLRPTELARETQNEEPSADKASG
ncbi:MAG: AMP-binding protein [Deltaproteobacteria bacterium]|nr:AMP-binding protein [Deltaproteobacteria bacterium]